MFWIFFSVKTALLKVMFVCTSFHFCLWCLSKVSFDMLWTNHGRMVKSRNWIGVHLNNTHSGVFSCKGDREVTAFIQISTSIFFFFFLVPYPWHMEVPRLGVQLVLQLPAYTTATAMPDPSHVCNPHRRVWQHQILKLTERGQGSNPHPHGY